jgi:RecA/RadA recombinase
MSYVNDLIKSIGNKTAASITKSEFCTIKNFYDSGSYIINGLLGGSFYKGIPSGVVSGWAGIQGSGKTYVLLKSVSEFLRNNKDRLVFVFESEGSYDKDRVVGLIGADVADRLIVIQVRTVEEFKIQIFKLLEGIEKAGNNRPVMIGLDSLGMLACQSDLDNAAKGKNTRSMQKQRIIKEIFTIISKPLKLMDIPLMMTNHVYTKIGSYVGGMEISGGMGFKFACRNIIEMLKRREKDGDKHIGTGITAIARKGLYVAEDKTKVKFAINFRGGISRYSGLYDFAIDNEICRKVSHGNQGTSYVFDELNLEITKADRRKKTAYDIFEPELLGYLNQKFMEEFVTTGEGGDTDETKEEKKTLVPEVATKKNKEVDLIEMIENTEEPVEETHIKETKNDVDDLIEEIVNVDQDGNSVYKLAIEDATKQISTLQKVISNKKTTKYGITKSKKKIKELNANINDLNKKIGKI